jgi:patatin-like phospholipase/acyl hydrolase
MEKIANNDDVFKVLTIDGGGIKGLYSARILAHLEQQFNTSISEHFDMLCGTSTGGIIALALSLKIPATEVCNFYETKGPIIFPQSKSIRLPLIGNIDFGFARQVLISGKFKSDPLRKALAEVFGDKQIKESKNLLCIPSYSVTDARPWIFKYDHSEGKLGRDNKALYVDVAMATTAAPTYFPMHEIEYYDRKQFVDGGIWGNNPTMVGLIEALTYFVGEGKKYKQLKILSISSLSLTGGKPPGLKQDRSFRDWGDDLFETSLTGQSLFTDYFMTKIKDLTEVKITYVRIPSPTISAEQQGLVQLDVATKDALSLINGKGNDMGELYKKKSEVEDFFRDKKNYVIK